MFGGNVRPSQGAMRDKTQAHPELEGGKPADRGAEGARGDGFHYIEMHENESGAHLKHTDPEGNEEHSDHASSEEAMNHADQVLGHEDMHDQDDGGDSSSDVTDDGPDFSGAYSK